MNHRIIPPRIKFERGFSLLEVMVYLSITLLVTIVGVTTFLSLDTTLVRNETERMLTHDASVALERMVREIRGAESVDVGLSILNTPMGTLALDSDATTTIFSAASGSLELTINGISQGALTSSGVTVENIVFNRYTNATTELVRVALTLHVSTKAASSTRTFYTSAVLRGSYE